MLRKLNFNTTKLVNYDNIKSSDVFFTQHYFLKLR